MIAAASKGYAAVQARHRKVKHKSLGGSGVTIADAIKHPGALTAKAKAAGMTVAAFAEQHKHDGDQTGAQSRFYLNVLTKTSKGGK